MIYLAVFFALLLLEIGYFSLAKKFNIIDKPNQRSSHTKVTLRGGGIVFYFGALLFFFTSNFSYPWFFLGLTLMALVSFLDDIFTLSNKIRLLIHFASVLLMANQLSIFDMPWYYLLIAFVFIVGVINAYNFMDGINGITACYSLAVGGLLFMVSRKVDFINQDLIAYVLLAVMVFSFFNFRPTAKCFAGDVGSVSIAYILLFLLGGVILKTGNIIYIFFLVVYGVDAVWTIVRRLYLKENIFEAHRSHLYQYLGNEAGVNKLLVSFLYGFLQLLIGLLVIEVAGQSINVQIAFSVAILTILSAGYLIAKSYVIRRYSDLQKF